MKSKRSEKVLKVRNGGGDSFIEIANVRRTFSVKLSPLQRFSWEIPESSRQTLFWNVCGSLLLVYSRFYDVDVYGCNIVGYYLLS